MKKLRNYWAFALLILFFAIEVHAQTPWIKLNIRTESTFSHPYSSTVDALSVTPWSYTHTDTTSCSVAREIEYTGSASVSGTGGSITGAQRSSAIGVSCTNINLANMAGRTYLGAEIKGGSNAKFTLNYSGNANVSITSGNGTATSIFSTGLWSTDPASASASPGPTSDSGSGSGDYILNGTCSPSGSYTGVTLGNINASSWPQNWFNGTAEGDGSATIDVEVGASTPIAVITNVPSSITQPGNITFGSTGSYDPDDSYTTTPTRICKYQWTVTEPDNTVLTGTSSPYIASTFTKNFTKAGEYKIKLKVTDNEGIEDEEEQTFTIGSPREGCHPHADIPIGACSDSKTSINLNPKCGDGSVVSHDPTRTRGYPLKNEIHVRSSRLSGAVYAALLKPFGNATFSYGIQVVEVNEGGSDLERYVVDGEGNIYHFGEESDGEVAQTPGVFSLLDEHAGGFTLYQAGPPDAIHLAGNYSYEFDTAGKLLTITDPNGNEQTLTYSSSLITEVLDVETGKKIEFNYSGSLVDEVVENGGYAVREITYDLNDNITDITLKDNLGATVRDLTLTYDVQDRIDTVTRDSDAATAATFSYNVDGYGRYLANIAYTNGSSRFNYFADVASGGSYSTKISNDKSGYITYDYDSSGNLKSTRQPIHFGGSTIVTKSYTYNSDQQILTESNGTSTWTYTYNSLGLLLTKTDAQGRYIHYTYDGTDLIKIEDNLDTIAEFEYNNGSLPHAVTDFIDGENNTWTFGRNAHGQVTTVTPPASSPTGVMTFTYDENPISPTYGYLTQIENGAGDLTDIDSYNDLGDVTSVTTHPSGGVSRTVQTSFDGGQRKTVMEHDDGKTVETAYDGANVDSVTDEAGTLTEYDYCKECGKLTGISGPMSWALAWVLDDDYDVTTFSDALTHNTTYQYGAARELKKIIYPDSTNEEFQYDNYGRLKNYKNGTGFNFAPSYDSASTMTTNSTGGTGESFTYYSNGQLKTHYNSGSTIEYFYTGSHLKEKIKYTFSGLGSAQWVEYDYNPDQTLYKMRWKNNTTLVAEWEYGYDGAGRITSIINNFGETTTFTYDGEGKLLTQTNQNGTSREYTYNNQRGWPTDIDYKLSSTVTASYDLVYDDSLNTVGNLTDVTELSGATVAYTYDDLYRLTGETRTGTPSYTRTYGYDLAGNITSINGSSFGTYDSANKSTQISTSTATVFDGNGSIVRLTGVPKHEYMEWSPRNQLTKTYFGTPASSNMRYNYLANGLRFLSVQHTSTDIRLYVFANDNLIGELTGSSGIPEIVYTWGPDGLISKRNLATPASHWYEFGPQGETRKVTNSSGATVNTYYYNAYGEVISSTGSLVNPYGYGAKYGYYTDKNTGYILAGQRWYSPVIMRWLSRDPIRYNGGYNLYEYVNGNPMRYIDPTGLWPWDGLVDLYKNYRDMKDTKYPRADKYFHCKGHCEATKRGWIGWGTSHWIGNFRELTDMYFNNPRKRVGLEENVIDCFDDLLANQYGRGAEGGETCEVACSIYRPQGLPSKY